MRYARDAAIAALLVITALTSQALGETLENAVATISDLRTEVENLQGLYQDVKAMHGVIEEQARRLAGEEDEVEALDSRVGRLESDSEKTRANLGRLEREAAPKRAFDEVKKNVQKSLAFGLTKNHLRYFSESLLKDDTFQKGVEYNLAKSERFVRAFSDKQLRQRNLTDGLVAHDRFRKDLATALARPEVLRPITDTLIRNEQFHSGLLGSSSFTSKLVKSDRIVNGLVDNSTFTSKLESKLGR